MPTEAFRLSMNSVALTLNSSSTELLGIAVRLASSGNDEEALQIIALVQKLNDSEDVVGNYVKEAGIGKILRLSSH